MSATTEWQYLAGLPAAGEVFLFHEPDLTFFSEGVVLRFHCGDRFWVGNFAPGLGCWTAVHILGSTAFVVANGEGYRVNINAPSQYDLLRFGDIVDSCPIEELKRVVFANTQSVCAHSEAGICWTTPRLSLHGLRLQSCTAACIQGVAENLPTGDARYFSIDAETGRTSIGDRYP